MHTLLTTCGNWSVCLCEGLRCSAFLQILSNHFRLVNNQNADRGHIWKIIIAFASELTAPRRQWFCARYFLTDFFPLLEIVVQSLLTGKQQWELHSSLCKNFVSDNIYKQHTVISVVCCDSSCWGLCQFYSHSWTVYSSLRFICLLCFLSSVIWILCMLRDMCIICGFFISVIMYLYLLCKYVCICLQCFATVGSAAGRASGWAVSVSGWGTARSSMWFKEFLFILWRCSGWLETENQGDSHVIQIGLRNGC